MIIGVFYELPDGRIVRTFGYERGIIHYYFDDGSGQHVIQEDECKDWKHRADLLDFPNARDPRLPYVFDLFYDIKHLSQLRRVLAIHPEHEHLMELINEHQIKVD